MRPVDQVARDAWVRYNKLNMTSSEQVEKTETDEEPVIEHFEGGLQDFFKSRILSQGYVH